VFLNAFMKVCYKKQQSLKKNFYERNHRPWGKLIILTSKYYGFRNIRHEFANEIELYKDDSAFITEKTDLMHVEVQFNGER
jgi:hypothetical protein